MVSLLTVRCSCAKHGGVVQVTAVLCRSYRLSLRLPLTLTLTLTLTLSLTLTLTLTLTLLSNPEQTGAKP